MTLIAIHSTFTIPPLSVYFCAKTLALALNFPMHQLFTRLWQLKGINHSVRQFTNDPYVLKKLFLIGWVAIWFDTFRSRKRKDVGGVSVWMKWTKSEITRLLSADAIPGLFQSMGSDSIAWSSMYSHRRRAHLWSPCRVVLNSGTKITYITV